jgi:hypothetical protein
MESKIPILRFVSFAKLKRLMHNFKEKKLEEPDKRLIRGLFDKKMKDPVENNTL